MRGIPTITTGRSGRSSSLLGVKVTKEPLPEPARGTIVVDATIAGSWDVLASTTAAALRFPVDWGTNRDAFEDGMRDLSWLPGNVVIAIGVDPDRFPLEDFGTLVQVMAGAASTRRAIRESIGFAIHLSKSAGETSARSEFA